MCKQDVQQLVEAAALNAIYAQQIKRVRELAKSFEESEQGFDFPGDYIALQICMALDGEK